MRLAKNEKDLEKAHYDWNRRLTAYIILKDEGLRTRYNEHNRSHKLYENLQKEYDANELKKRQNSQYVGPEQVDCDENATGRESADLHRSSESRNSVSKGNPFRRASTASTAMEVCAVDIVSDICDCINIEASASDGMVEVEQTTEMSSMVTIAPIEKIGDAAQINPVPTSDPTSAVISQAFSISNLPPQSKTTNQNTQAPTGLIISSVLQRKLFQAREIQAQRAVDEKKAQAQCSIQAQETSTAVPKQVQLQRQTKQNSKDQKLRDQKVAIQRQLDAQRAAAQRAADRSAAVQKSLGLNKAPPTGPRIQPGMAPRMMMSPFANRSSPVSSLNLRPQPGLKTGSAPILNKFGNVAGSAVHLLESSEQSPASKKQRIGNKEVGGTKEIRSASQDCGGRSGGEMGRIGDGREDGEILEDEGGKRGGRREDGEIEVKEGSSGKKRKRDSEHRVNSKGAKGWDKVGREMRDGRIERSLF